MDTNFSYLSKKKEFALFGPACIDAENVLATSPVMSAVASRKALELCVKWIYSTDYTLGTPREDGLQALLHNNGFPYSYFYSPTKIHTLRFLLTFKQSIKFSLSIVTISPGLLRRISFTEG